MKKKIIIFLIIVVLLAGGFFLVFKLKKGKKETAEEKKQPPSEVSLSILNQIEPVELSIEKEPDLILKGQADKTTDTFSLSEGEAVVYDLVLILNNLELAKDDPFYEILIYKVDREEPVGGDSDTLSLAGLKESGWQPEKSLERGEPKGTILGDAGLISGPGEFYFVIDIENLDEWTLELRKVKSPF